MAYVKWFIIIVFWLIVGGFLHYTLPQYDVVRIVNTNVERIDLNDWTRIFWAEPEDQSVGLSNRDVQFIYAKRPNGRNVVYRNEDTGWGWPPYFKFDTSNLFTDANDAVSTEESPKWVSIMHYGWRNEFLSIYPNAISIKPVEGPDHRVINWFNIIFLTILFAIFWAIWVRWRRFRRRRIDPVIDDLNNSLEAAGDRIDERRGRFRRWLSTWRAK